MATVSRFTFTPRQKRARSVAKVLEALDEALTVVVVSSRP